MTLFYESCCVWRRSYEDGAFIPRSFKSPILAAVTLEGTRVAVLVNQRELHILSLFQSEQPNATCLTLEVPLETEDVVTALCWSVSGTSLGVTSLNGTLMLWTSLGVLINAFDLTAYLKSISSFTFLTESVILLAAGNGKLLKYNVLTVDVTSLISVGRYHAWPQLLYHPERELYAMSGVLKNGELNVTLWKYRDSTAVLDLVYSYRDPLSGFSSWMRGMPDRDIWSRLDFSPDGQALTVSREGLPPLIFSLQNDEVLAIQLDVTGLSEVMSTANGAVFWSNEVLVLSTSIEKLLFLGWTEGDLQLLGSESVAEKAECIGRAVGDGMLYLSDTTEKEKRDLEMRMLQRQSASEHLSCLVQRRDFEAALHVAEMAELPKEDVYMQMWTSRESKFVPFSELEGWFDRVKDKEWVIRACSEVTSTSFQDQKRILEHGLSRTELYVPAASCLLTLETSCLSRGETELDEERLDLMLKLLRQLEFLYTFEALHPGCFSSDAFERFRSSSIEESAIEFARNGNIQALQVSLKPSLIPVFMLTCASQVLFKHHVYSLLPSMLSILKELPCTLSAREYKLIMPRAGMTPTKMGFVSSLHSLYREKIVGCTLPRSSGLPDGVVHELTLRGVLEESVVSEKALSTFYSSLAERIEDETGSLSLSKSILELGIQNGIHGLEDQLHSVSVFEAWLSADQQFWNWSSGSFGKLTTQERIENSLQNVTADAVMEKVESALIPLSMKLPLVYGRDYRWTLLQYVLQRSTALFEKLISHECVHAQLFGESFSGVSELSEAVICAVRKVDRVSDWDQLYEALDLISRQEVSTADLQDMMEDCHIAALLEKHGLHIAYSRLRNLTHADGQRVLKSVLGHAMRTGTNWSDNEWDALLSDLMTIALRISHLSKTDCDMDALKHAYFQTLLRASRFALADYYMEHSLDLARAEEIAWEIGREVLCSITDLDNTVSIDQAKQCFDLFPSSKRAQAEIHKLKALSAIRSHFSVTLLPLEMEQLSAKSEVIERILGSSEKHYKKGDVFMSLCQDLQLSDEDFFNAWGLLCRMALKHKDLNRAKEFLQDLRDRRFTQSWTLALEIVQEDQHQQYLTLDEKQDLWSFVISHCDSRLQECIEEMKNCFEMAEDAELTERMSAPSGFSCHDDAFLYLADESYRAELREQDTAVAQQKCSVYDFVYGAVDSVNNTTTESSEFLRSLLDASPHGIVQMLKAAPEFLHAGRQNTADMDTFEHRLQELQEQDQLQTASQRIQSILPALDIGKFCTASQQQYRQQIILELAGYAGELLYSGDRSDTQMHERDHTWQDVLDVALEQGAEFNVEPWSLHCRFVCTVSGLVDRDLPSLDQAILASEMDLMKNRTGYVKQVLKECWSDVGHPSGVANLIHICMRCVEADGSATSSTTAALSHYASRIRDMSSDESCIDFRVPVYPLLSSLMFTVFGFSMEWTPATSEMQHLYDAVSRRNQKDIIELYEILEEAAVADREHAASLSQVCLVVAVKLLVTAPEMSLLTERDFWKVLMAHLLDDDLEALIEFTVFNSRDALIEALSGLDEETQHQIQSWHASLIPEEQRLPVLMALLEEAIDVLDASGWTDSQSDLEKCKDELKRLRRLHATRDFCGMGVTVAGDNFSENLKNIIKELVGAGKKYSAVLDAIYQFSERSGEDSNAISLEKSISDTLLEWMTESLQLQMIVSCLDEKDPSPAIQALQEHVWRRAMDSLIDIKESGALDQLACVLSYEIWKDREWSVTVEDRWCLFSCTAECALRARDIPAVHADLHPLGFSSVNAVEAFLESLLEQEVPLASICVVLDTMCSLQTLLGEAVAVNWLSPWYSRAFHGSVSRGEPQSVLRYLGQYRVHSKDCPMLGETEKESLIALLRKRSLNLSQCLSLLLSSDRSHDERITELRVAHGDANMLALVLYLYPDMPLESLLIERTWLTDLIEKCPPHPDLIEGWDLSGEESGEHSCPPEEEVSSQPAMGDGWDIDDEIDFENATAPQLDIEDEIAAEGSGGWSDIDELEISLQGDTAFEAPGEEPVEMRDQPASPESSEGGLRVQKEDVVGTQAIAISDEMDERDASFIGACCLPTVLALATEKGRSDIAARILAQKLNLHHSADMLTAGKALLKNYLRSFKKASTEAITVHDTRVDAQWSKAIVHDLMIHLPATCDRALAILESED